MTTTSDGTLEAIRPPQWAEDVLCLLLKPDDRASVSGDLLEEYRQAIRPVQGEQAADWWYIRQVGFFLWRTTWIWAVVFSGAFIARTAYDWLVPTNDFYARSTASTMFGVAVLLSVGFCAAWRCRSVVGGTLAALVTSQIAAALSVAGASLLLAVWHDPATWRAIDGSGGIEEVFVLPFMMAVPGLILGTAGGVAGSLLRERLPG
jgi:hypothetical protein